MTVHPFPRSPAATHGTPAGDRPGADLPRHRAPFSTDMDAIDRMDRLARLAEMPPHFAGLQQGDVARRWIDRQSPADRALFHLLRAATVAGALLVIVMIWGAW